MVQRYNPDYVMHAARFEPFAREAEHGEYVKFSDYEALVSELASSRKINDQTLQVKLTMAETIKELTDRVNALAVENAEMRSVIDAAIGVANNSSGIAGWHLNGEIADWDEILPELNIETPATDAALAAIEARGVEKFADMCREKSKLATTADSCAGWKNCSVHASSFAIRLREAK
ncbi:eae-like domain protein [Serratia marcescens]|uniref:eae-like domain protein n=1 Tax=Serratia marcescens TaxID=615 RepID=UPI00315A2D55